MKVTSVNVKKIEKEGSRMKGIASIVLDECFAVKDIRIIQGEEKLFIAMPSRKYPDGEYRDVAHPINTPTREEINKLVLAKYEEEKAKA